MQPQHCLELSFGCVTYTHDSVWLYYVLATAASAHVVILLEMSIWAMERLTILTNNNKRELTNRRKTDLLHGQLVITKGGVVLTKGEEI